LPIADDTTLLIQQNAALRSQVAALEERLRAVSEELDLLRELETATASYLQAEGGHTRRLVFDVLAKLKARTMAEAALSLPPPQRGEE
jgi:hypothetical protein